MLSLTVQQLQCLEAVAEQGSLQAAAEQLGRTHPAVSAAVRALEAQLGLTLFDRSGYRMRLTDHGRSVLAEAQGVLRQVSALKTHATQLAAGEETHLRVVIGDLTPLGPALGLLRGFFEETPWTRLDLMFETLGGPLERLLDDEADLMFHHIDKADPRLEFVDLGEVRLIPVCAADYAPASASGPVTPERVRAWTQCVVRDTARHRATRDYYLVEGGRRVTVADQLMKLEVILTGMGWGHMPDFMVAPHLACGQLRSLLSQHFPGDRLALVAARRRDRPHGPVAERLWARLADQVLAFSAEGVSTSAAA